MCVSTTYYNGERRRVHHHHLKTTVRCGQCGSRLIIQNTKNKRGVVYPYFVCSYRQRQRDGCHFKAVLIDEVEAKVAELYRTIRITPAKRSRIAALAQRELERIYVSWAEHVRQLEQQSRSLLRKRQKLLDAHYADAIPLDLLKQEQDQIAAQLASIEQQRAALSLESHVVQTHLGYVLDLLEDCFSLYRQATPSLKKLLNGVFFTAVAINPQDDASGVRRMATAHLQPVISVLRQFDDEVDDGGKENTAWVSTASGVHDNACLSKGIVVLLTNLDMNKVMPLITLREQLRSRSDVSETTADSVPLATPKRAPHKRLSKQQRQEALERYRSGQSYAEIGRALGVHRATIAEIIKRNGEAHQRRTLSSAEQTKAKALHASGVAFTAIAGRYGVVHDVLSECLTSDAGV